MSRTAARFTQADVARALRAAQQVAPGQWRVRITRDNEIIVEPVPPAHRAPEEDQDDGWLNEGRGLDIVL